MGHFAKFGILSGLISFIALIVFFVMAFAPGKISKG